MVLHCDSPVSCYIWKQNPVAVGQFDREGGKNKLHPLFPTQAEMFPREWGKGTYLQGGKVLTRSRTRWLFSINWCHNWLCNKCTWLQMGFWNIPPLGPAAFTNVQLEEKIQAQNEGNTLFFGLSKSTHEAEKNKLEKLRPSSLRFPVSWVVLPLNYISVICGECFPSKPD